MCWPKVCINAFSYTHLDAQELQNYFNSKSWYYGTIEPENFDVSLLTDVEKKNAEFLSDVEFSISANGYQLDQ